jgi:KDO2-lipid IV(A) lauroyltransferase
MTNLVSYLIYGLVWLISLLPFRILYFFSDVFYLLVCYVIRYRKAVIEINLKKSFPEKTDEERVKIQHDFYHHFCDTIFETIKLLNISEKSIKRRYKFSNPDFADEYFDNKDGVVIILGHFCNWEWAASFPIWNEKCDLLPIYKPLHNEILDKMFINMRSRFGGQPLPKKNTLRVMIKAKEDRRPSMTCFIGDQTPTKHNINYWTNFLNQDTPIFIGVERIARKLDQPVYYSTLAKIKRGYYEVGMQLICEKPKETAEFEITETHTRMLERDIIAHPAYWLWSHKRWKHSRN